MKVPISGQVTGASEAYNVGIVANSDHYGGGIWTHRFERGIADFMGRRFGLMTNSGSSAVLLALASLELPKGSRVLTCAVNFPTTVNAIVQLGHVPVFVDADPKTLNISRSVWGVDAAIVAHTLGNPADIQGRGFPYPLIEDCRRLLRRARQPYQRGAGRKTRRRVHCIVLPCPPHHDRRGRDGAAG